MRSDGQEMTAPSQQHKPNKDHAQWYSNDLASTCSLRLADENQIVGRRTD